MVELLAPAGSCDSLRAAVNAGADAVYIGGSKFGARAYADNPGEQELLEGIDYCHIHGRKLYLTVNTLLKEQELEEELYEYLLPFYREGLDGVILQDLGVLSFLRESFPGLPLHASTQMSVTGPGGALLLKEQGISRVVTARELSLEEIRNIISETHMEIETFIHGAMCYSYSGQCLLSSMIGGRSGNRGRCAQPCRLPYQLEDGEGNGAGARGVLLGMKDLCTVDLLPELVGAGIASLKIEGRMKRPEYTAGVVSIYRKYLDAFLESGQKCFPASAEDRRMLMDLYNRGGFTAGYYHCEHGPSMISAKRPNHCGTEAVKLCGAQTGARPERKASVRSGVQKKAAGYSSGICTNRKDRMWAMAQEPLFKGDVLEQQDSGVSFTLAEDVARGGTVALPGRVKNLPAGAALFRTKCPRLLDDLKERFLDRECKEKIKGELKISEGKPAILRLSSGKLCVSAQSEHPVERAETSATAKETIRKQIRKLGNTPFELETLEEEIGDGLFVPVRELNELRRRAVESLQDALLESRRERSRRDFTGAAVPARALSADGSDQRALLPGDGSLPEAVEEPRARFAVSVMSEEQLNAVLHLPDHLRSELGTVYIDVQAACTGRFRIDEERLERMIGTVKEGGFRCFLNMPPVFRTRDAALFSTKLLSAADGFLIHSLDEAVYLLRGAPGCELVGDDTLYAYNRRAQQFLRDRGIRRLTLPSELNFRELLALDTAGSELVVYGHQALMQTAQCLWENTQGCSGHPDLRFLRDRKNMKFPVLNRCSTCSNTIYNSVPLDLSVCAEEIRRLHPGTLRLSFTSESRAETADILARFLAGRTDGIPGGTRGHFKRGVE